MKKVFTILTLALAVTVGRAALPEPDLIAQIHFAGAEKISSSTHFTAFTNQFCSAEALALRKEVADKFAPWLAGWLAKNLGVAVADGGAKLRPLFDDLQSAEWFLEARAAAGERPEVALAIQIAPARAQIWTAGLKPFLPAASFQNSNGWLIFESGPGAQKLGEQLAQKISTPTAGWLTADVNWPRLAQWYPKLKSFDLPETQFTVTAPDDRLRISGKFKFPENLALDLGPWRIPTNTIHSPLVSFTAVRGLAAWLKSQPWAWPRAVAPAPNQLFVWALPQLPFQTFAAMPVANATNALPPVLAWLKPVLVATNRQSPFLSQLSMELTNREINIRGIPFVSPFIRALAEPAGQFLLAGGFPNTPRGKSLPPELLAKLAENKLLYYHWENTAERLPQVLNMSQLALMIANCKQLDAQAAAFKWIEKIKPTTGVSITEITQTGPAEMTFTRKAPSGLTAVEWYALANWLGAPNFPGCDLKLPARPRNLKFPQPVPAHLPAPPPPSAKK